MKKLIINNGKALADSTGKVLAIESDVTITSGDESIGLSGEYDGTPIEVTESVDMKALIDEKKIPLLINVKGGSASIKTKGGWEGTAVPNGGYVENVYFNTALSINEVASLLKPLNYQEGMAFLIAEENTRIVAYDMGGVYYLMDMNMNIYFSGAINEEFGITFEGWNTTFNGTISINAETFPLDTMGGYQNESIISLFSITPFEYSEGNITLNGEYDGGNYTTEITPTRNGLIENKVNIKELIENSKIPLTIVVSSNVAVPLPKLPAPTISIDGTIITMTPTADTYNLFDLNNTYNIYVNGKRVVISYKGDTFDINSIIDYLDTGENTITVTQCSPQDNVYFEESDQSNSVTYTGA